MRRHLWGGGSSYPVKSMTVPTPSRDVPGSPAEALPQTHSTSCPRVVSARRKAWVRMLPPPYVAGRTGETKTIRMSPPVGGVILLVSADQTEAKRRDGGILSFRCQLPPPDRVGGARVGS